MEKTMNEDVLKKVSEKLEAEGFPTPPGFKKKLSTEESLLLHVFLDHLYMQVLPNLKQARKELEAFAKEAGEEMSNEAVETYNWLKGCEENLKEGYDIFAKEVEVVPDLATMKVFRTKLEEELQQAAAISLEALGMGENGDNNSN